jgi:hypothetical protein
VVLRAVVQSLPLGGVQALQAGSDPLGWVVPGLIASAAIHRGAGQTLTGLAAVTAATWWALIALGLL